VVPRCCLDSLFVSLAFDVDGAADVRAMAHDVQAIVRHRFHPGVRGDHTRIPLGTRKSARHDRPGRQLFDTRTLRCRRHRVRQLPRQRRLRFKMKLSGSKGSRLRSQSSTKRSCRTSCGVWTTAVSLPRSKRSRRSERGWHGCSPITTCRTRRSRAWPERASMAFRGPANVSRTFVAAQRHLKVGVRVIISIRGRPEL
jgi:hypothetical protein